LNTPARPATTTLLSPQPMSLNADDTQNAQPPGDDNITLADRDLLGLVRPVGAAPRPCIRPPGAGVRQLRLVITRLNRLSRSLRAPGRPGRPARRARGRPGRRAAGGIRAGRGDGVMSRPRFRIACCLCGQPIPLQRDVYALDAEWQRRFPRMVGTLACGRCVVDRVPATPWPAAATTRTRPGRSATPSTGGTPTGPGRPARAPGDGRRPAAGGAVRPRLRVWPPYRNRVRRPIEVELFQFHARTSLNIRFNGLRRRRTSLT